MLSVTQTAHAQSVKQGDPQHTRATRLAPFAHVLANNAPVLLSCLKTKETLAMLNLRPIESLKRHDVKLFRIRVLAYSRLFC